MEGHKTKQCWECRRRRLVCDFTRPGCRKCQVRGVACPGYDGRKLRWLQPHQVNAKGPLKWVVPRPPEPESNREMGAIFEAIEYYNVHISPDLVATGAGGPRNPYFMHHFAVPSLPRSCTQSLICTALCHRVLQLSDAPASAQAQLAQRLQRHRGEALRALADDLGRTENQTTDSTLAAVLLLLLVEIQQSFTPNWRHHSNGAATMIEMKGGLSDLVFSRPSLRPLLRYYSLIEVMGNTTSPKVGVDSARNHLELTTLIPVLYGNGLATCFPCPPDLFIEIIHINHLRSQLPAAAMTAGVDAAALRQDKFTTALGILRRIRAFQIDKWAAEVGFDSAGERVGFGGWQTIAYIYQSAITIYCIASLLYDNGEGCSGGNMDPYLGPREVLFKARNVCRSVLLGRLREASRSTQLRKLVLWPLVVAGIEAEDNSSKHFVLEELKWISNSLGTATPLIARDFLEQHVWRRTRGVWDGLFDQSYVFVL
ncbi:Arginine metabolism regulation protein II [Madurella mycetomatis]|uniref:Arginine metabolism regulation protein II n=1 Tax=Madurella mycetomatis TaxID=100816 RepID=A0A175WEY9_9PEZI|nr:Arginine metabolism regulation protein II [Madurella mycetomatis]